MTDGSQVARDVRDERHGRAIERMSAFAKRSGHEAACLRLQAFMIAYLAPLKPGLPHDIKAALGIAGQFQEDLRTNEDISKARDTCWQYLETGGIMYDFANKENCAVRAVLATLARGPIQVDLNETLYWFLLFSDHVEDQSDRLDDLIARYFDAHDRIGHH
jgi:hypothetical protein